MKSKLTDEFVRQIRKRYHANFGMTIEDELTDKKVKTGRNNAIKNFFLKAI